MGNGIGYRLLDRNGGEVKVGQFTPEQVAANGGITYLNAPSVIKFGERFFEHKGSSSVETNGDVTFEYHEVTQVEVE